ncbi:toxic anion resistance protein [Niallia nealsonii]|uniref:Toxic anion resistance protein n=1 Tax=Niallia nealsonii TaxID=115979 RepID=A0A2N0Z0P3_9BACI|nr:toxic anion resistance protein [Niallia nealsonii]PKG23069.1 toxic anion resistance protein [Niallia nealsonii]
MSDGLKSLPFEKDEGTEDELFLASIAAGNINTLDKEATPSSPLINRLSDGDKQKAYELAGRIEPSKHGDLVFFGAKAQKNLLSFSYSMLEHVQKKEAGDVGVIIAELMGKLNEINPDELKIEKKSFFARLFGRASSSVQEVLSKYQKTSAQIDRINVKLGRSKNIILSDIHLLEQLYQDNKNYFYLLNMYIAAGELKLQEVTNQIIPEMKKEAERTKDEMKLQEAEDMMAFADQLAQRIYDLKISRQITIQTAPQIRLIQHTNKMIVEKIQSSIMTTIPLWRNQVALALTLLKNRHELNAQKRANKTTEEILQKNSRFIQNSAVGNGEERIQLEIETLKNTHLDLISRLEETLQLENDSKQKRMDAQQEFEGIKDKWSNKEDQ